MKTFAKMLDFGRRLSDLSHAIAPWNMLSESFVWNRC